MDTAYADAQFVQSQLDQGKTEQEAVQLLMASKLPGGRDLGATFDWATNQVKPVGGEIAPEQSINNGVPIDVEALKANLATPPPPADPAVGAAETVEGATPAPQPTLGDSAPSLGDNGLVNLSESQTSTSRKIYKPEDTKAVDDLAAQEAQYLKKSGDLLVKQKEIEYEETVKYGEQLRKDNEAEALAAAAEKQLLDQKMAEYDALVQEEAGTKLDSNRFWTRLDTGNRILAGVSLALGALGQALTQGKSNMALDVIDKAIDRDIDEQKFNIDQLGKKKSSAQGLYQMYLQKVGNEKVARSLTREAAWKAVANDFKAKSALVGTEQARNAGLAAETGALANAANARMEREAMTRTDVGQNKTVTKASLLKDTKPIDQIIGTDATKRLEDAYTAADAAEQLRELVGEDAWKNVGKVEGTLDELGRKFGLSIEEGADVKTKLDLISKEFLRSFSGMGVTDKELQDFRNTMPSYTQDPKVGVVKMQAMIDKYQSKYERERARILEPYVKTGHIDSELAKARFPSFSGGGQKKDAKHGGKERNK